MSDIHPKTMQLNLCNHKCSARHQKEHEDVPCLRVFVQKSVSGQPSECRGQWLIFHRMGEDSANGIIYNVCDSNNNCQYVFKHIALRSSNSNKKIYNEVDIQNTAAISGIAPNIAQVIEGPDDISIIMEGLQITMKRALIETLIDPDISKEKKATYIIDTINAALELLHELHQLGVVHQDAHLDNFMWDGIKWYLIDFGMAEYVKNIKAFNADFHHMMRYIYLLLEHHKPKLLDVLTTKSVMTTLDDYVSLYEMKSFELFDDEEL